MHLRPTILALLLQLVVLSCFGQLQNLRFRQYTMADGIAYDNTNCVFQDSRGYIWIGTEQGLSRFDGLTFKNYFNQIGDSTSLSENRVNHILEDSLGYLWIATRDGGLNRFDPRTERFKRYMHDPADPSSLPGNDLRHILLDAQGRDMWVSTFTNGIAFFDREQECFEHYLPHTVEGHISNRIHFICQDIALDRRLWLAGEKHLWSFDKKEKTFSPHIVIKQGVKVSPRSIYMPNEEELWLGTWGRGLTHYHIPSHRYECFYPDSRPLAYNRNIILDVLPRSDKELWVADFSKNGFGIFDRESRTFHMLGPDPARPFSIKSHSVARLYQDKQGILWITNHENNGVELLDPAFNRIRKAQVPDLPGRTWPMQTRISDFLFDQYTGQLIVATIFGGGLLVYDKNMEPQLSPFPFSNGEQGAHFPFLFQDKKGKIWTAEGNSLLHYDPVQRTYKPVLEKHFSKFGKWPPWVSQMGEDSMGILWMVDGKRLLAYDPVMDTLGVYPKPDWPSQERIKQQNISDLRVARDDKLWIAMDQAGLARLDPQRKEITYYNVASGHLISDFVTALCEGEEGKIWLGMDTHGIQVIDPDGGETLKLLGRENGLPNNSIRSLKKGSDGKIWIGTRRSLAYYDPQTGSIRALGEAEGLSHFYNSIVYPAPNGYLYAGGEHAFNYFHIDSLGFNPTPPPAVLQSFKVNNKELPLNPGIDYQSSITLTHDQNIISISFAALNYTNPRENQYKFTLEGAEDNWQYAKGLNRTATYANLRPGQYTFRLMAANNDGLWNEEERRLDILILPPWWATDIAYMAYILLGLVLAYGIYRFQLHRRLAEAEAHRLRELDTFKTNLYTNITHEFRTPLAVILGLAEQIRGQAKIQDLIRRNGQALLRLVNQMLDLRKLEVGSLQLYMVQADLIPFLQHLCEPFHSSAKAKGITLTFHTDTESLVMDHDPERLRQVVSNLLSNAIKFTPNGGKVKLRVTAISHHADFQLQTSDFVQLRVEDDGQGIPPNELDKVFERFYQVDATATRKGEGTGIGLALAKELVESMGGSIEVESELNVGTVFRVVLPVRREAAPAAPQPPIKGEVPPAPTNKPISKEDLVDPAINQSTQSTIPLALIVEDNPDVAHYLQSCLQPGYRVAWAADGKKGREKALELVPDVIISDVMMPEMDGFELCRTLKADERTSHIPIILLTARAGQEDRLEGLEQGADAYLAKPFDRAELEVRLRKLLELRRQLREKYQQLSLLDENGQGPADEPELNFLRKLQRVILDNLSNEDFKVEPHLCQAMAMSRPQLYRKLRALKDTSPSELIKSLRMQQARRLILQTELKVGDVAEKVGFKDHSYFTRTYSAVFGESPSETRDGVK